MVYVGAVFDSRALRYTWVFSKWVADAEGQKGDIQLYDKVECPEWH